MRLLSNGKISISQLASIWREIITTGGGTHEIEYRLEKLILRLNVVADKIFIKTVRANDMLLECVQLTEHLQSALKIHGDAAFPVLTRLEGCIDQLVTKTHEFRIKAG